MSHTTTADPRLIPDIEAFEERVAIMVHEGGTPTYIAMDLAAQAQGLPQSGSLLGLAQGLCGKEAVGVGAPHTHDAGSAPQGAGLETQRRNIDYQTMAQFWYTLPLPIQHQT